MRWPTYVTANSFSSSHINKVKSNPSNLLLLAEGCHFNMRSIVEGCLGDRYILLLVVSSKLRTHLKLTTHFRVDKPHGAGGCHARQLRCRRETLSPANYLLACREIPSSNSKYQKFRAMSHLYSYLHFMSLPRSGDCKSQRRKRGWCPRTNASNSLKEF